MQYDCLKGLEPADFFYWFGQICQIPHGSHKEEKLVAFLTDFARKRGFFCESDESNNLLVRVPATTGYESQPPFLLQAHSDMVWQADVPFDFENSPIDLQVVGNKLMAKGTTLGADNAVGMATMLALADGDYPHPELELLFTAAEEVGMVGIKAFDLRKLKSRRMLNMDCGDSHVLCVTSAGSITGQVEKSYSLSPVDPQWQVFSLTLTGGKGGHSGICANMGRACGVNLLADLLLESPVRLCALEADGAIIKQVHAIIAMPADLRDTLQQRFARIKIAYQQTDPDWQLLFEPAEHTTALSSDDSADLLLALSLLRTGQVRNDGNLPQFVMTSGQLRSAQLRSGALNIMYGVRSASNADGSIYFDRTRAQLARLGLQLQLISRYSGWQEREHSPLRQQFAAMHQQLFGYDIAIERIHGGIEVGTIMGAIPDMDAVGLAPTARGAHTTGEYLLIDEVAPYWQLLTAVLAEK